MVVGVTLLSLASVAQGPAAERQAGAAPQCTFPSSLTLVPDVTEASGLAVSRNLPGRLWTHNDSGQPTIFALDTAGAVTERLRLMGSRVEDWEALAVGPCPGGSCLYVADIGDNDARRTRITIYRVAEPSGGKSSVSVQDIFHATYPDGAHDAETLLIAPDGTLLVVTKGDSGPVALYRFPKELRSGATHPLERVGNARDAGQPAATARITDGAVSADGVWVVLRTQRHVVFHRMADLFSGNWREAGRLDVKRLGESQGEGIALGADGTLYLAGEGGGKSRPGTFARLTCSPR